jgi:hypothetical protein
MREKLSRKQIGSELPERLLKNHECLQKKRVCLWDLGPSEIPMNKTPNAPIETSIFSRQKAEIFKPKVKNDILFQY